MDAPFSQKGVRDQALKQKPQEMSQNLHRFAANTIRNIGENSGRLWRFLASVVFSDGLQGPIEIASGLE